MFSRHFGLTINNLIYYSTCHHITKTLVISIIETLLEQTMYANLAYLCMVYLLGF